ncbi:zinc-binding dehydrogenase [Methylocapsa sp. S129]|uniref:zinc-binding dehydrogenase n=1 Tax=Methylocapsa sp. S129 TaxID=1641869 RepID=UPI00131BC3D5
MRASARFADKGDQPRLSLNFRGRFRKWPPERSIGLRFAGVPVKPGRHALKEFSLLVDMGKLRAHVERMFPLERAAGAHRFLVSRPLGNVVLAR